MVNALEYIRQSGSMVSCDTMDPRAAQENFGAKYFDATSNQVIGHMALGLDANKHALKQAVGRVKESSNNVGVKDTNELVHQAVCRAMAIVAKPVYDVIEDSVMAQTLPSQAYDTAATVKCGRDLMQAFEAEGMSRHRVTIKVPSTWEGLQACEVLHKEGVSTLATMCFSLVQAQLAAEVGCKYIAPYVDSFEHILNVDKWKQSYDALSSRLEQPGVALCKQLHEWYRSHGVATQILIAGMVDARECVALAGIDAQTIPPALLKVLGNTDISQYDKSVLEPVTENGDMPTAKISEPDFRWRYGIDRRANELTVDALRAFYDSQVKLENLAKQELGL